MPSIRLLLLDCSQTITTTGTQAKRSVNFLGHVHDGSDLAVTRGDLQVDGRQCRWIVSLFDSSEEPLSEFYAARMTERDLHSLAAAVLLQPPQETLPDRPDVAVYVWLPASAFDSLWMVSASAESSERAALLTLNAPFRGSALIYSSLVPDEYDTSWNTDDEDPLLIEQAEIHFFPSKRLHADEA